MCKIGLAVTTPGVHVLLPNIQIRSARGVPLPPCRAQPHGIAHRRRTTLTWLAQGNLEIATGFFFDILDNVSNALALFLLVALTAQGALGACLRAHPYSPDPFGGLYDIHTSLLCCMRLWYVIGR